jgi:hypothetical protein
MWEEEASDFDRGWEPTPEYGAPEESKAPPPASQFPQFPQAVPPPNMVRLSDLYDAARTRAVADQQLSKLFNPEYYI